MKYAKIINEVVTEVFDGPDDHMEGVIPARTLDDQDVLVLACPIDCVAGWKHTSIGFQRT